jgi:cell division transport system permease protein
MKFVGATDWFIRWPFVVEGIIIGIIGSGISFMAVTAGYSKLAIWAATGDAMDFVQLSPAVQVQNITALVLFTLGIFLGAVGSIIAVRKHSDV